MIEGVRPDLVYLKDGLRYALEVQHSSISPNERDRRDQIYRENSFTPMWIFHKEERENKAIHERGRYGCIRNRKDLEWNQFVKLKDAEWFDFPSILYLSFEKGVKWAGKNETRQITGPCLQLLRCKAGPEPPFCEIIEWEDIFETDRLLMILAERKNKSEKEDDG
nr:hypothetical protein [Candidatus Sigynarchaeota archaeon]